MYSYDPKDMNNGVGTGGGGGGVGWRRAKREKLLQL